jgi:hypothetical protein
MYQMGVPPIDKYVIKKLSERSIGTSKKTLTYPSDRHIAATRNPGFRRGRNTYAVAPGNHGSAR